MKKKLILWQIAGFVFTGLMGTLLHFAYDWSGGSPFVALFSAVNESTWEHMKLLFVPMFVFSLIESFFLKREYPHFWCAKLAGTLVGLTLIPVLFYTYNGAIGPSPDWLNIAIFFISAAAAYLLEFYLLNRPGALCLSPIASFAILCILAIAFLTLTASPPRLPLFRDPTT